MSFRSKNFENSVSNEEICNVFECKFLKEVNLGTSVNTTVSFRFATWSRN
jgi:hypothetical protein